jgi:hypothetical protein
VDGFVVRALLKAANFCLRNVAELGHLILGDGVRAARFSNHDA